MKFATTLVTGLVSLASLASARITGITLPTKIGVNEVFNVTIKSENYIQSIADIAFAFGVIQPQYADAGSLGMYLVGESFLGPTFSNQISDFIVPVGPIPDYVPKGETLFNAALFSLLGSRFAPTTFVWNATVTLQDKTDYSQTITSTIPLTFDYYPG
ncbi:uncharacterized protein J3D65DRAFT_601514 [Phyllosticta citribraziliensis]|uniref:Uncharacterized protein n=1 Tax=Phyllosticta citribraziliensis TaxID=989973 RepID=A0ABR1LW63_9PEZI